MANEVIKTFLLILAGVFIIGVLGFFAFNMVGGLTGNAIIEESDSLYSELNLAAKIFLLVQFLFFFGLFIYYIVKTQKAMKERDEISQLTILETPGKGKTDIDTLYTILQDKKKLRVSSIAKAFNVDSDVAMEWCKILELGEIAIVDYPGFIGEPSVVLVDKVVSQSDTDKKDSSLEKKLEEKPKSQQDSSDQGFSTKSEIKDSIAQTEKNTQDKRVADDKTQEIKPTEKITLVKEEVKTVNVPLPPKPPVAKVELVKEEVMNLTEKDKQWAKEAIDKGLTRNQASDLLKSIDQKKAQEIIKYYDKLKLLK